MNLNKPILTIVFVCLLITFHLSLLTPIVIAQAPVNPTPVDYKLPYPGILPDHPLYNIKRIRDRLLYVFNRSPVKKIELALLFADKKIGMASLLFEKGSIGLGIETVLESQQDLLKSASLLPSLSKNNLVPTGLSDKIELSLKKHRELISYFSVSISDIQQKEKIDQALEYNHQANSIIEAIK